MGRDVWWRLEFMYLRQGGEIWDGTSDRPGCGWGSSRTDFELMECDPCFLGPESSS